ncbi:MAG TPA: recombinase RecA [Polyangiaceae bacterium LLY-WYZ-14_1]|nr:recombinase RecA [Polyangiaceae bacterium LLY-WYZ-14_1]
MAKQDERDDMLKAAKAAVEKTHGKGAIMLLGDGRAVERVATIASGAPCLDQALGVGGYPRGRIVEIFGPESSGKTTLTLHAIAECQRAGGVAAFVDAEHALDVAYAKALGVDPAHLLVSQPDTGEQALDIVESLLRSSAVDLVVVDSVAALTPQAEIEGDMGDQHVGLQARLMSQALRKLNGVVFKTNATLIFINQLRMKIGVTFGSPETTTGGNALRFYASVRLDVRRIGAVKSGDAVLGNRTKVKVVKNKLAPPFKTVEFDIRYGEGVDVFGDVLDAAVAADVVEKSGAYYAFRGERLGQGREKARERLRLEPELFAAVRATLAGEAPGSTTAGTPSPAAAPKKADGATSDKRKAA